MKKLVFIATFLACSLSSSMSFAANRFFVNGGVSSNWGDSSNWSLTSGGAGGNASPTTADAVFFDGNSPTCTVDRSTAAADTLDFTGYTDGTGINMQQQLTVSGSVTLDASMVITGTNTLIINGAGTHTSNGKVWPNAVTWNGVVTHTFADDWTVLGLVTLGQTSNTTTFTGDFTINMSSGLNISGTTSVIAASGVSPIFNFNSTGTWTQAAAQDFRCRIKFSTGVITLPPNATIFRSSITYVGGEVVTTNNTLQIPALTHIDTSTMTWNNITVTGTTEIRLLSDIYYAGLLINGNSSTVTTWTGNTIHHTGATGGYRLGTTGSSGGTATFSMEGSGDLDGIAGGETKNNFTVNTAGSYAFVDAWGYDTGTFTWTAGTYSGSVPLACLAVTTFTGTQDILWESIAFTGNLAQRINITNSLKCSGLLSFGNSTQSYTFTDGNIYAQGGIRHLGTNASMQGTTVFNATGTGTIDAPSATSGRCLLKLILNAPGGTITFDGTGTTVPFWDLSNVLYTAGTIVTDAGTWASGGSSASSYGFVGQ